MLINSKSALVPPSFTKFGLRIDIVGCGMCSAPLQLGNGNKVQQPQNTQVIRNKMAPKWQNGFLAAKLIAHSHRARIFVPSHTSHFSHPKTHWRQQNFEKVKSKNTKTPWSCLTWDECVCASVCVPMPVYVSASVSQFVSVHHVYLYLYKFGNQQAKHTNNSNI